MDDKPVKERKVSFLRFIPKMVLYAFAMLGVSVSIFIVTLMIGAASLMEGSYEPLPDKAYLSYELYGTPSETRLSGSALDLLSAQDITLRRVIKALEHAADDDRIKGAVFHIRSGQYSLTAVQELRAAVKSFRDSGKFAYAWSDSYGGFSSGMGGYYLASAFDQIWLQPLGMVGTTGIRMSVPYFGNALEKIGVKASFYKRREYKNAMEAFTQEGMSDASRSMMESIVDNLDEQIARDITTDRKITPKAWRQIVDMSPLMDHEAKAAKLVDQLDYQDGFIDYLHAHHGDAGKLSLERYLGSITKRKPAKEIVTKPTVALVNVSGPIMETQIPGAISGSAVNAALAINDIVKDRPDIDVIVLRVDSPGGSPTASEVIRRAVINAQTEGKTIIVSMGGMAASGGYWVATDADYIIANPATLTGSIGVVAGKFVLSGLWEKLGVNWENISTGRNADMWSLNHDFGPVAEERLNAILDNLYREFVYRVAQGRNMTFEQAEAVAKGRAWTGEQALAVGLVDRLGGLNDAFDLAAQEMELTGRHDIMIETFPKPKTPWEEILAELSGGVTTSFGPIWDRVQSMLTQLNQPSGMMVYQPLSVD